MQWESQPPLASQDQACHSLAVSFMLCIFLKLRFLTYKNGDTSLGDYEDEMKGHIYHLHPGLHCKRIDGQSTVGFSCMDSGASVPWD